jgi:hypothetical protein
VTTPDTGDEAAPEQWDGRLRRSTDRQPGVNSDTPKPPVVNYDTPSTLREMRSAVDVFHRAGFNLDRDADCDELVDIIADLRHAHRRSIQRAKATSNTGLAVLAGLIVSIVSWLAAWLIGRIPPGWMPGGGPGHP